MRSTSFENPVVLILLRDSTLRPRRFLLSEIIYARTGSTTSDRKLLRPSPEPVVRCRPDHK